MFKRLLLTLLLCPTVWAQSPSESLADLEQWMTTTQTRVIGAELNINQLQQTDSATSVSLAALAANVASLRSDIARLEQEIRTLTALGGQNTTAIEDLQRQVLALDASFATLEIRVAALEAGAPPEPPTPLPGTSVHVELGSYHDAWQPGWGTSASAQAELNRFIDAHSLVVAGLSNATNKFPYWHARKPEANLLLWVNPMFSGAGMTSPGQECVTVSSAPLFLFQGARVLFNGYYEAGNARHSGFQDLSSASVRTASAAAVLARMRGIVGTDGVHTDQCGWNYRRYMQTGNTVLAAVIAGSERTPVVPDNYPGTDDLYRDGTIVPYLTALNQQMSFHLYNPGVTMSPYQPNTDATDLFMVNTINSLTPSCPIEEHFAEKTRLQLWNQINACSQITGPKFLFTSGISVAQMNDPAIRELVGVCVAMAANDKTYFTIGGPADSTGRTAYLASLERLQLLQATINNLGRRLSLRLENSRIIADFSGGQTLILDISTTTTRVEAGFGVTGL